MNGMPFPPSVVKSLLTRVLLLSGHVLWLPVMRINRSVVRRETFCNTSSMMRHQSRQTCHRLQHDYPSSYSSPGILSPDLLLILRDVAASPFPLSQLQIRYRSSQRVASEHLFLSKVASDRKKKEPEETGVKDRIHDFSKSANPFREALFFFSYSQVASSTFSDRKTHLKIQKGLKESRCSERRREEISGEDR